MSIPIQCDACGFASVAVDGLAGKAVRCRRCQGIIHVPSPAVDDGYDPDEIPDPFARPAPAPAGPSLRFKPMPDAAPSPRSGPAKVRGRPQAGGDFHVGWIIGAIGGFGVLSAITLAVLLSSGIRGKAGGDAPPAQAPPAGAASAGGLAKGVDGPIELKASLPAFPEVGPGNEIEPGVRLHEIRLGASTIPGHGGKLWLYLPAGSHADRSLPCVLIAGAGSTLLTGMALAEGDRPEHLPYVRAGFAVLAYELDGHVPGQDATDAEMRRGYRAFRAAQAGLVNAHVAIEYVLARVPQVDPARLFAAGHSSAGTMAVLFAEHEPRLAGCVAYAPCIDVEARLAPHLGAFEGTLPGIRDFLARSSPKNHESRLNCPLFIFFADDDLLAAQDREFADRLMKQGKPVTSSSVPSGGHYRPMIEQGIPQAIAWMTREMTGRGQPAPTPVSRVQADPTPSPPRADVEGSPPPSPAFTLPPPPTFPPMPPLPRPRFGPRVR